MLKSMSHSNLTIQNTRFHSQNSNKPRFELNNKENLGFSNLLTSKNNNYKELEFECFILDEEIISNKIPESRIRLNNNLLTARNSNQQFTDGSEYVLRGSPNKENSNNASKKSSLKSGNMDKSDQVLPKKIIDSKEGMMMKMTTLKNQPNFHNPNSKGSNLLKLDDFPNYGDGDHGGHGNDSGCGNSDDENIHTSQSPRKDPIIFESHYFVFPDFASRIKEKNEKFHDLNDKANTKADTKAQKSTNMAVLLGEKSLDESFLTHEGQLGNKDRLQLANITNAFQNKRHISVSRGGQGIGIGDGIKPQSDLREKVGNQGHIYTDRLKAKDDPYINKELLECTFTPKTNYANTERRNVSRFLEDQNKFLADVESKRKKMLEKVKADDLANLGTHKPELCKGSLRILEKKLMKDKQNDVSIYDRLYKKSKNQDSGQQPQHQQHVRPLGDNRISQVNSQIIGQIPKGQGQFANVEVTFVPNIQKKSKRLKREEKVDDILYKDALRRKYKSLENVRNQQKIGSKKNMSSLSKRALATRFVKEFDSLIIEFLEYGKEPKLNYVQVIEFLKKLRFLKHTTESLSIESSSILNPDHVLVYDMWYTLNADKSKGLHRRNLLVFLLAVLGLRYQITKIMIKSSLKYKNANTLQRDEQDEQGNLIKKTSNNGSGSGGLLLEDSSSGGNSQHGESRSSEKQCDWTFDPMLKYQNNNKEILQRQRRVFGVFDSIGNLELTDDDVKKIQKIYDIWYLNRMHSFDYIGQIITNRKQEEHTYHPEILKNSKQLAKVYREKILEETAELIQKNKIKVPNDGRLTHADLLVLSKKIIKEKVEQKSENLKVEKLRDCTFRPQTLENGQLLSRRNSAKSLLMVNKDGSGYHAIGHKKSLSLYALAKQKPNKQDRNREEIEYEKNCEECTFTPDISTTKNKKPPLGPADIYAKNMDKTIDRMRIARVEREHINQVKERGFPNGNEVNFHFSLNNTKIKSSKSTSCLGHAAVVVMDNENRESSSPNNNLYQKKNVVVNNYKSNATSSGNTTGRSDKNMISYIENQSGDQNNSINVYSNELHNPFKSGESSNKNSQEVSLNNTVPKTKEDEVNRDELAYEKYMIEGDINDDNRSDNSDDKVPLIFVDVNLGQGRSERIIVYEGDKSEYLAKRFAEEHGLDNKMKEKLKELLDNQIAGVLSRIDEEANSIFSESENMGCEERNGRSEMNEGNELNERNEVNERHEENGNGRV